ERRSSIVLAMGSGYPEKYKFKKFIKLKCVLGVQLIAISYLMSISYFIAENIMLSAFILVLE
ncbi:hypothetical protein, partial [Providencia stuartii]|uniref:hypothetical protein n=1 Tax=Providencia stuartii TaxID=588 RepID=UPI0019537773